MDKMTPTDIESGRRLLDKFMRWEYHNSYGHICYTRELAVVRRGEFNPDQSLDDMALVEAEIGRRGMDWQRKYNEFLNKQMDKHSYDNLIFMFKVETAPPMARFISAVETVKELNND